MRTAVDLNVASEQLEKYMSRLAETGEVGKGTSRRYMIYLFLVDFVDTFYGHLTSKKYELINKIVASLFDGSNCLLQWRIFEQQRVHIGSPYYEGTGTVRLTEDSKMVRKAENDIPRIV